MSTATAPQPERWETDYTIIAAGGAADGIEVGQRYTVRIDGETVQVRVVEVSEDRSVLEVIDTGLESYGKSVSSVISS